MFLRALLFDVSPFPFLPAFIVMLYLQMQYHLSVWPVLFIGVAGSILGPYLLTLYIRPDAESMVIMPRETES